MYVSRDIRKIISNNLFKGKVIIIFVVRRVGKTVLSKNILDENKKGAYYNCELLRNKLLLETTIN